MGIVEFNLELQSVKTHCTHTNTMSRGSLKQIPSAQTTLQIDIKNVIQHHKFSIFITIIIGSNYRAPNYVPKYWVTPRFSVKKSFNIQELLHRKSKRHVTNPMHPSSSRVFQRHQEHDLKHPGSVDLITTKQTTFLHR
jgi:hypothetical protein